MYRAPYRDRIPVVPLGLLMRRAIGVLAITTISVIAHAQPPAPGSPRAQPAGGSGRVIVVTGMETRSGEDWGAILRPTTRRPSRPR